MMVNLIKLQTESILQVPLHNYPRDFTFIVNGELFPTSRFHADLLSSFNRIFMIYLFNFE